MFDHQLSSRLGQRVSVEQPGLRKADAANERPEAPYDGLAIWRTDLNALEVYDAETDTWASAAATGGLAVVGEIKMWLTGAIPNGYLLLNGQTVSRTTYLQLWALWGTTFGAGDGSTTFTLPDMRSRVPIGAGTFAALGTRDGVAEASRTPVHSHGAGSLANANSGAHGHTGNTDDFVMADSQNTTVGGVAGRLQGSAGNITHHHAITAAPDHTHTVSGATAGSGATALPYLAVNFIVKY